MKDLICPKCLRVETVTDNARAWCTHGRPESRFNPAIEMEPQLAESNA